ncbi:MAG: nitronate monooxygenase [Bryobacteraceae bacterium]|nr:nitronate monooxygenase [Bryobacteraceae bacterium]
MKRLLEIVRFQDSSRAAERIARLAPKLAPEVQAGIRALLCASPDPDQALHMLTRLQEEKSEAFERLTSSVAGLSFLITVFSYSRFLSEAVLKNPEWMEELIHSRDMDRILTTEDYQRLLEENLDAEAFLDPSSAGAPHSQTLAQFRRKQLLRILIRDVQGFCTLAETTEELSNLADAILEVTLRRVRAELAQRHGSPLAELEDGATREAGFAVISLGKLGGRELNYSSDIDLMFVYEAEGETGGPVRIPNKLFFQKLANRCSEILSAYTVEGRCYRVDLRLRPEGRLGEVAVSVDAARRYYQHRARDWELQMLIKARDRDTVVTGRSTGHPVRVLQNKLSCLFEEMESRCVPPAELEKLGVGRLRAAMQDGDVEMGSVMAGQICAMVSRVQPVAEIIQEVVTGAEQVLKNNWALVVGE